MNTNKLTELTEERVNEIFSVPETQRLLKCFLEQEEKIGSLSKKMTKILIKDEKEAKRCIEGVIKKRICSLAEEKGQAIEKIIQEQLQNPTLIDQIAVEIEGDCYKE